MEFRPVVGMAHIVRRTDAKAQTGCSMDSSVSQDPHIDRRSFAHEMLIDGECDQHSRSAGEKADAVR